MNGDTRALLHVAEQDPIQAMEQRIRATLYVAAINGPGRGATGKKDRQSLTDKQKMKTAEVQDISAPLSVSTTRMLGAPNTRCFQNPIARVFCSQMRTESQEPRTVSQGSSSGDTLRQEKKGATLGRPRSSPRRASPPADP